MHKRVGSKGVYLVILIVSLFMMIASAFISLRMMNQENHFSSSRVDDIKSLSGAYANEIGAFDTSDPIIYVDNRLTSDCLGTYSIQNRNCAGNDGTAYNTLKEGSANLSPGGTLYIREGEYVNLMSDCSGAICELLDIEVSGTSDNPTDVKNYNGERVVLKGFGYSDLDELTNSNPSSHTPDGYADGIVGLPHASKSETLVAISGNYIRVSGLEITNSSKAGLTVLGNYNIVENCRAYANWLNGFSVGGTVSSNNNIFRYLESHHNRHGGGILLGLSSSRYHFNNNNVFDHIIAYYNGYLEDGTKVLPLPSDPAGGGNSDAFSVSKECNDRAVSDSNPTPEIKNFCLNNTLIDIIGWNNADDGVDVSFANSTVRNTIMAYNGPEGNKGYKILRDVYGRLIYDGNIAIGNIVGFEPRVDPGYNHILCNNLAIDNSGNGYSLLSKTYIYNSLGVGNGGSDLPDANTQQHSNNWAEDGGNTESGNEGDPELANRAASFSFSFPAGYNISQRWTYMHDQFVSAYTPAPGSPLIDAGVVIQEVHCPNAGEVGNCRTWYGAAPDIGAFEYTPQSGVDLSPPTVNLIAPSNNTFVNSQSISLNATITENTNLKNITLYVWNSTSKLVNTSFSLISGKNVNVNKAYTFPYEGIFFWNYRAFDNSSNSAFASQNYSVIYDASAPLTLITSPLNITYNSSRAYFNISLDEAGSCRYSLNNGITNYSLAANITNRGFNSANASIADGSYTLRVYCNDSAGNMNSTSTRAFSIDTTAPMASFISPANTSYTNRVQLVNISHAGASNVWYFNGNSNTTYSNPVYLTFNEGSNTLLAYANDSIGNLNTLLITFFIDSAAPTVTITSPTNKTYDSSTIAFNVSLNENGLARFSLNNGITNISLSSQNNRNFNYTNSGMEKGNYIFRVYANDTLGNQNNTARIAFTLDFDVDATEPSVTTLSPADGFGRLQGNVTFTYNVTDTSNIANCSLIVNGATVKTNNSIIKGILQRFSINDLLPGRYLWNIECFDTNKNQGVSRTKIFSILLSNDFGGNTTNLSQVNLNNLTNLIIEKPDQGRINFTQEVDLSGGADLDVHVNITWNRIYLNSSALSALNVSARLHLYNLTFSSPRILRDSIVCPATECINESYSNGTFIFTVNSFSEYSSEETPQEPQNNTTTNTTETTTTTNTGGGSSGGSGGSRSRPKLNESINISYQKGSEENYTIFGSSPQEQENETANGSNNETTTDYAPETNSKGWLIPLIVIVAGAFLISVLMKQRIIEFFKRTLNRKEDENAEKNQN